MADVIMEYVERFPSDVLKLLEERALREDLQVEDSQAIREGIHDLLWARQESVVQKALDEAEKYDMDVSLYTEYQVNQTSRILVDAMVKNVKRERRRSVMIGDLNAALLQLPVCNFWPLC